MIWKHPRSITHKPKLMDIRLRIGHNWIILEYSSFVITEHELFTNYVDCPTKLSRKYCVRI